MVPESVTLERAEVLAPRQLLTGPGSSHAIGAVLRTWGVPVGVVLMVADRVVAAAGLIDLAAMARWPGLRALARQHWRMGVREFATSVFKRRFTALARQYVPSLTAADLLPARSGVRAQAVDRRGGLVDDFVIDVACRVVLVRNAPSPAATSSLAVAEHVAGLVAGAVR